MDCACAVQLVLNVDICIEGEYVSVQLLVNE